jgi:catechol 2,3-dioxygenase
MILSVTDDDPRRGGRYMSYKPRKLGHVNIFVRNAERARDWYEDLLGLHTHGFTPGRAAFMTSDLGNSHEIALVEVGEDAPGPQKGQVGLNHMAWYMDSIDDLKELYFRIKEKNIKIERVSDHGHAIGIYIRDPDGNGIEVSYEMPSREWGHDENRYMIGNTQRGRLPGPWDDDIARDARART